MKVVAAGLPVVSKRIELGATGVGSPKGGIGEGNVAQAIGLSHLSAFHFPIYSPGPIGVRCVSA